MNSVSLGGTTALDATSQNWQQVGLAVLIGLFQFGCFDFK
jgi:hypothetical protein